MYAGLVGALEWLFWLSGNEDLCNGLRGERHWKCIDEARAIQSMAGRIISLIFLAISSGVRMKSMQPVSIALSGISG